MFSSLFIEFVRGVPLITVLFMASVMLPLFVPQQFEPDKLLGALIGIALFASAYWRKWCAPACRRSSVGNTRASWRWGCAIGR